jgi:SAM-dependent methyltransferase
MNRQECYRQAYRCLRPEWQDSLTIYRELIEHNLRSDARILDLGCGSADFLRTAYANVQEVYGIDPDRRALCRNAAISAKVAGTGEDLPFGDDQFDLIVLTWVIEHLDRPAAVVRELYRVLKPGGQLVFLTPNVWNYNVWMIRMVPNRFHHLFTQALYGRRERETYAVRYRMNSVPRIETMLRGIGFRRHQVILNGDPSYISFNGDLFSLACALERLLEGKLLRLARVHIIGCYCK